MALSANSVFEIRLAGSDTNGGGFVTGSSGTDYSRQNTNNTVGSDISTTDVVAVGTTTLTSATANFSTGIVGNIIYLTGGTGALAAGWYQVASRTNTTTIVVDRAVATGTGITMNIGGAFLSTGTAANLMSVAGMSAFLLNIGADGASVYSLTTAATNVSGGAWAATGNGLFLQGYTTNRVYGNSDPRPTIQANASSIDMFNTSADIIIAGVILDGNSQLNCKLSNLNNSIFYNCIMKNFTAVTSGINFFSSCISTGNTVIVFTGSAFGSEAFSNTASGFSVNSGGFLNRCISYNNSGATSDGFTDTGPSSIISNCISYNNGRDGFRLAGSSTNMIMNNHSESNAGFQYNIAGFCKGLIDNSYFSGSGGGISNTSTISFNNGMIHVTAGTVFVNAAGGNFALNSLTGQGALLRQAGTPAIFPAGTTANFLDIGAAQHNTQPGGSYTFVG